MSTCAAVFTRRANGIRTIRQSAMRWEIDSSQLPDGLKSIKSGCTTVRILISHRFPIPTFSTSPVFTCAAGLRSPTHSTSIVSARTRQLPPPTGAAARRHAHPTRRGRHAGEVTGPGAATVRKA